MARHRDPKPGSIGNAADGGAVVELLASIAVSRAARERGR